MICQEFLPKKRKKKKKDMNPNFVVNYMSTPGS